MSDVRERDSESALYAAWLVRGGEHGEREEIALGRGLVIAGWEELGSISDCESREGIRQALMATYPEVSDKVIGNWTGQLWRFKEQIKADDLVVMPLHTRPGRVAIGRIIGPYEYRADEPLGFRQVRRVEWLRPICRVRISGPTCGPVSRLC